MTMLLARTLQLVRAETERMDLCSQYHVGEVLARDGKVVVEVVEVVVEWCM